MTVTQAARQCGLSRSTLLYYESAGLIRPPRRAGNSYRSYGEKEIARLQQIRAFRQAGLEIEDIKRILDRPEAEAAGVLRRRLVEISGEIEERKQHQAAILRLLRQDRQFWRSKVITKEKWVAIMKSAGFSEDDMRRWHGEFEKSAPSEHQEFLEFLHIPPDEVRSIRAWSKEVTPR